MSLIKKNIAANFAGSIWQALVSLAFVPLYIKFLGIESWGLIGFFVTLQAMFSLLDLGLSSTLNREMARLSVLPGKEQEMRDLVRTLEVVYWCIAVFVGVTVVVISPVIAHHWIKPGHLAPKTIQQALLIMGFVIALQMPAGFYSGGIMGLQKQVLLNVINVCISTMRAVGAVLVLRFVSPTIQAYFLWQFVVSIVNVVLLAFFLWHRLPFTKNSAVFQQPLLKGIWRFTAGMSGIAVLSIILTQMDKVILSKMLSLEIFGYYMLASMVAMSLGRLVSPIFFSMYPRFTQLVAINDQAGLIRLYHKSCQLMSVLILPVAIVITLFSYEIILLWTHNPVTAERTHLLVSILICGTALNGVMNLPYALQLAFGWTRLSVLKNIIAVSLLVPAIIYMTKLYGATGAASVWLFLNLGYVMFEIPVMHSKLLREEKWRWYWQDFGAPLIIGSFFAGLGRFFMGESMNKFEMMSYVAVILMLAFVMTALLTPVTHTWLVEKSLKVKFVSWA
jgi:O-antigen/teichoic acid export membrane protein